MPVRFPLISTLIRRYVWGMSRLSWSCSRPPKGTHFISGSFRPETGLSVITPVCHPIRATGRLSGAVADPLLTGSTSYPFCKLSSVLIQAAAGLQLPSS